MFRQQQKIHADFFRQQCDFGFLAHHVGIRHAVVGVLENKLKTDFHGVDLAAGRH